MKAWIWVALLLLPAICMAHPSEQEIKEKLDALNKKAATKAPEPDNNLPAVKIDAKPLVREAWTHLKQNKNEEALALLNDASKSYRGVKGVADEVHAAVLHGLAVANMRLKDYAKARPSLETLTGGNRDDRVAVMNLAKLNVAQKQPTQSIPILTKSLSRREKIDEQMLNLLGYSIDAAADMGKLTPTSIKQFEADYDRFNEKLEKQKPGGEKRWGSKWVNARKFKSDDDQRREALRRLEKEEEQLATAINKQKAADQEVANASANLASTPAISSRVARARERNAEAQTRLRLAKHEQESAQKEVERLQKRVKDLKGEVPRLPWEVALEPELPNLVFGE